MESETNSKSSFSEPLICSIEFKSGAIYQGAIAGGKRSGRGAFTWPSGLYYNGHFKNNQRHGYGQQVWPDGSRYEGKFRKDVRHGNGKHEWKNGECYEGEYCNDLKHGKGSYRWSNGAVFTGEFKGDIREGQGTYIDAEGNRFEGVYHNDMRDGEGVFTYSGGHQDVGMWKGTKLVQLTSSITDAIFIPRLKHLFNDISGISLPDTKHRNHPKGFLEVASEDLIHAAVTNDVHKMASILKSGAVHVDVCERGGHTPLFAAAIHCHSDIIHILLHNGADVNAVNVMGVSVLTACHHLLYSHHPRVQALLRLLPPSLFAPGGGGGDMSTEDSPTGSDHSLHSSSLLSTIPDDTSILEEEMEELGTEGGISEEDHQGEALVCEEYEGSRKGGPASCPSCPPDFKPHKGGIGHTPETSSYPFLEARQEKKVRFVHEEEEEEDEEEEGSIQDDTSAVCQKPGLQDLTISNKGSCQPADKVDIIRGNEGSPPAPTTSPQVAVVWGTTDATPLGSSIDVNARDSQLTSNLEVSNFLEKEKVQSPVRRTCGTNARSPVKGVSGPKGVSPSQHSALHSGVVRSPVLQDRNILMLKKAELHSSSVFSSTAYGPIVSAAQSTSLLTASAVSLAKHNATPSQDDEPVESLHPQSQSVEGSIDVLLQRGADPNTSDIPLPPIVYTICAGDVNGVIRLLAKGARVHSTLTHELGGSSLLELALLSHDDSSSSIVEALLEYGANPNLFSRQPGASDQEGTQGDAGVKVVAGENQGATVASPLHLLCSTEDIKQDMIVEKVRMLLDHGADVNRVAGGHSPLSLAIVRGYDQVVDVLLKGGADPNLPLGKGVGSAMCSLTLHAALKRRDLQSSLSLLGKLISHKADILLPIRVWDNWPPGTAVDFAHEAFKQDKRLANIKYPSLNKSERLRYKAAKKLAQHMILLLRAQAADTTPVFDPGEDLNQSLPIVSRVAVDRNAGHRRSTSAEPPHLQLPNHPAHPRRKACSALPGCRVAVPSLPSIPSAAASAMLLPAKTTSEPTPTRQTQRQLSRRQGPLLDRRPITAFTYPPAATLTPTAPPHSRDIAGTCGGKWDFFSFCYECGRSSGVHLTKCPMCKAVCYCSLSCRESSWKTDHRESCAGWRGSSGGSGLGRRSTAEGRSKNGYGSTPSSVKPIKAMPMVVWLPNSLEPFALSTAFPQEPDS